VLDVPLRPPPGAQLWAATLWPDHTQPSGWTRRRWPAGPTGRGLVPAALELADIVEFGAALPERRGRTGRRQPTDVTCWYGYTEAITPDSLTLRGPYPGPHQAHAAAQQAILQFTRSQQTPPGTGTPGAADPDTTVVPAQPPAAVSVAFHGLTATVGDPHHGWLVVPTDHFAAALEGTAPQPIAMCQRWSRQARGWPSRYWQLRYH
jgi:hypothetical protein